MINLTNKRVKIKGDRIYLRTLDEKNATQEYCGWLNNPEVNKYLETREASIANLKQYIKGKNEVPNCLFLGIFLKGNNKHIGNVKLEPIDLKAKKATFGILIGDKNCWGKGIGTEVTKIVMNYAFNDLGLEEVNLGVLSENKAAIKIYEKVGFYIEKKVKKGIQHGNKFYDKIVMKIRKMK